MDYEAQKNTVKDLKTVKKFVKIASTMLSKIATSIGEDSPNSDLIGSMTLSATYLNKVSNQIENNIEDFKTEQHMPGNQLKLF